MTEIESRLESDLKTHARARSEELGVLRMLKSALHNEAIAKRDKGELSQEDVVAVFRRELKRRKEAALMYEQGGREELAKKEKAEAVVIEKYLPAAPGLEEIRQALKEICAKENLAGPAGIGKLTKAGLAHFKGTVDGQTISQLAREILST